METSVTGGKLQTTFILIIHFCSFRVVNQGLNHCAARWGPSWVCVAGWWRHLSLLSWADVGQPAQSHTLSVCSSGAPEGCSRTPDQQPSHSLTHRWVTANSTFHYFATPTVWWWWCLYLLVPQNYLFNLKPPLFNRCTYMF